MMFEEMTYDELELRCGKFYLSHLQVTNDIKLWHRIMSNVLVIRCEHDLARFQFEYTAFSPLFDKHPPNEFLPRYEFKTNEYNDLEAVRVDD